MEINSWKSICINKTLNKSVFRCFVYFLLSIYCFVFVQFDKITNYSIFRFLPDYLMPIVTIHELKQEEESKNKSTQRKLGRPKTSSKAHKLEAKTKTVSVVDVNSDVPKFMCHVCKSNNQMTESQLKAHFKTAHPGKRLRHPMLSREYQKCDVCHKEVKTSKTLKEHMETHTNQYSCDECSTSYRKVLDYVIHTRVHNSKDVFQCLFCDFNHNCIKEITHHLTNHETTYKYKCKICNKGFNVLSWYQEHENFHTGATPFECEFCGKKFPYTRFLCTHKIIVHRDEVINGPLLHECVICKKRYQHKNSLKLHMNVHTGNVAVCDICGKQLSSKEKLKFHLRIHTGYKPFNCKYCQKSFTKKPILVEHERIHTGEKPYDCNYCEKSFSQRSSLVIHIRSHTGERPYVCHLCNKGFVARAMLNVHFKNCKGLLT